MKLIVIADIHANLSALEAVLADARRFDVDQVVCLGDLVGYNAQPRQCLMLIQMYADVVVAGNHDQNVCGTLEPLVGTNSVALQAQIWTRAQLSDSELSYLAGLPNKHVQGDEYIAVHGCYLNEFHVNGYVTETMVPANLAAIAQHPDWPRLGFCGHTHIPLLAWLHGAGVVTANPQVGVDWPADAGAILLNPGSVGQPRDYDPRAAYAYVDTVERRAEVRRVAYDVDATVAAFRGTGLPPSVWERLYRGS